MAEQAARSAPSLAIVGLACRFPDADDAPQLLDVVLTGRRAFRRIPQTRMNLADYYLADPATSDSTYSTRAALIEGWKFDPVAFGIDSAAYAAGDPALWLALETTARALAGAGLTRGTGLNRDRTGVVIGNSVGGDTSRANALRVRWPYVRRVLADSLATSTQLPANEAGVLLRKTERRFLAPFPPVGPDGGSGRTPGSIAAAVSNYFGFRGGSHAVDSAFSSSLQAVVSACTALASGELDTVVAGGVDISLDPLDLIGLARSGVLATGDVRLYDQQPTGYLPAEGCGMVVLMRSADARASNLPVYAEIVGWGTSSGGPSRELEPGISAQLLAMVRAYDRAGVDPEQIQLFEGNGAAAKDDDEEELAALGVLRAGALQAAALGSVKANIGHAKAAAGSAGLIKTVLSLSTGVIPPTTGVGAPHEMITSGDAGLTMPQTATEWPDGIRLAAVSNLDSRGSNVHIVLRREPTGRPRHDRWPWRMLPTRSLDDAEPVLPRLMGPASLPLPFLLNAPDRVMLGAMLDRLVLTAGSLSDAELQDIACALTREGGKQGAVRVGLVASGQEELAIRAAEAASLLPGLADGLLKVRPGIFATADADGRVTLLLSGERPGQSERAPADLVSGPVMQCLDVLRWLESLDVQPSAAVGHGVGALAGLAWAGVLGETDVTDIARLRSQFLHATGQRDSAEPASPVSRRIDTSALRAAIADKFRFGPPRRRLISTLTGSEIQSVENAIDLISTGFAGADRLGMAIGKGAVGATLLLETGPGGTLTTAATKASRVPAISLDAGLDDPASFARATAALFAAGAIGQTQPIFAGVASRPIDLWRERTYITNPCEVRLEIPVVDADTTESASATATVPSPTGAQQDDSPPRVVAAAGSADAGPLGTRSADSATAAKPASAALLAAVTAAVGGRLDSASSVPATETDVAEREPDVLTPAPVAAPPAPAPAPSEAADATAEVVKRAAAALRSGDASAAVRVIQAAAEAARIAELEAADAAVSPIADIEPKPASAASTPGEPQESARATSQTEAMAGATSQTEQPADLADPAPPTPADRLAQAAPANPVKARKASRSTKSVAGASAQEPAQSARTSAAAQSPANPSSVSSAAQPSADARPRCYTEELRPVQRKAASATNDTWRLHVAGSVKDIAVTQNFATDSDAPRTLAIIADPTETESRAVALRAAREAVTTGQLVVLARSPGFSGFFAALHAEHPALGVTVLRVPDGADGLALAAPQAYAVPGEFRELVVTSDGSLLEPSMSEVALAAGGAFPLGAEDVVLVSRGARGAGLALAQVLACCGTPVAVVGRAASDDDSALVAGLEELRSAGARIGYEVIDIAKPASLAAAVQRIERRLGRVTAIGHAASAGDLFPVMEITDRTFDDHLDSDAAALEQLVRSVRPDQLRMIVTFGSVAGRYGMAGGGLLALSGAALADRAGQLASAAPGCRSLHVDVPAWSMAGLGERPGLAIDLAAAGVAAMDLTTASRLLLKIMTTAALPDRIAVHGQENRPAARPAPAISAAELAAAGLPGGGRFLRDVQAYSPGTELVCAATLSLDADPYLADYRVDGIQVLPPVLALEALAQAASVLAGRPVRAASDVRFESPIVVPPAAAAELRICAKRDGDSITATLRCADSSYAVDHVRATFAAVGDDRLPAASDATSPSPGSGQGERQVAGAELYGAIAFQTGRFRRVTLFPEVTAKAVRALADAADRQPWFPAGSPVGTSTLLLGSPGLNDASLHALQACLPHRRLRPAGCDSVVFSGLTAEGTVEIRAVLDQTYQDGVAREPATRNSDRAAVPAQARAPEVEKTSPAAAQRGDRSMTAEELADQQGADSRPLARKGRRGQRRQVNAPKPVSVSSPPARIELRAPNSAGVPAVRRANQRWNIEAVDSTGQVLISWRGVRLRDVGPLPRTAGWPPSLLSVYVERSSADLGLDPTLMITVSSRQPDAPPAHLLVSVPRQAAGKPAGPATGTPRGKPKQQSAENGARQPHIAVATSKGQLTGLTLRATAALPVACNWTTVENGNRQPQPPAALAAAAVQLRSQLSEPPGALAARLRAVAECLTAFGDGTAAPVHTTTTTGDGWALLQTESANVACGVVEVHGVASPVAIAILTASPGAGAESESADGAEAHPPAQADSVPG